MDTLAKRVKFLRKRASLLQEELAEKAGLQQGDISKIENGKILKTTALVALAKALRCEPEWLESGEGPMQSERTWPFVLLTPEQVQTLPPEHLATVEKVAIDLWKTTHSPSTRPTAQPDTDANKSGGPLTFQLKTKRKKRSGPSDSNQEQPRKSGGG